MASLLAIGNDLVAKFEGVRVDGKGQRGALRKPCCAPNQGLGVSALHGALQAEGISWRGRESYASGGGLLYSSRSHGSAKIADATSQHPNGFGAELSDNIMR